MEEGFLIGKCERCLNDDSFAEVRGLAADRNGLISINGPSASHQGSSLDGEQVGSKNLSLGRMMVGFSCREASGAFFVNGLEEEVVEGVQGMDEDGFLISR